MDQEIRVRIPYNFKPRNYQVEVLQSKKRFKICVWHRRAGKTKTALNQQVLKAQKTVGQYYFFAPTYRQVKQIVWDTLVRDHIPEEAIDHKNESELAIYYRNGSIQRFCGCEDIDKHRGINPIDVVFDEYSEIKEEMWTAIIQPVLRENKGSATFIFTPKGKNHSWKLLQMAKDSPDWFWSIKSVEDTNALEESEIEAAKREMPQMLFQQEFLCSFIDDAGAFFRRIRENVWLDREFKDEHHKFQLGVDLAKYVDWTVITPFNLVNFCAYNQIRFNMIDYNLQKSRIEAESLRYTRNGSKPRVYLDATGVGDPVLEDLDRMGLNIEGIVITG